MHKAKILALAALVICLLLPSHLAYVAANDEVYITGVTPVPGITVDWLVPYASVIAMLPSTTTISLSNGSLATVTLNWISITDPVFPEYAYNPSSGGIYTATATFQLPEGVLPNASVPLRVTTTVRQLTALLPGNPVFGGATPLTINSPLFDLPGAYVSTWMILNGFNRTYHYYVPTSYDGAKPVPLVFSLHGGGSCGLASLLGVDDCAEKHGFIAVCPDYSYDFLIDFVSAIIDEMTETYNIDTRRIYACGISMGGGAAIMLALGLPDKIAAIGSISSSAAATLIVGKEIPRPMTMIFTGGTEERHATPPRDNAATALAAANWLVQQYHCNPEPEITFWPSTADDRTNVTRYVWSGGIYGTEVVVFAVGGGGHAWPGGLQYLIPAHIGWVTYHVEAWEDCLWPFLSKHALPEEVSIDVKPCSCPNPINLKSKGVIPVAILTTCEFDAAKVDPQTVRFGREGWEAKPVHYALEDVDDDGDIDLILHFRTQETGLQPGDTTAKLTGRSFYGTDTIKTVP